MSSLQWKQNHKEEQRLYKQTYYKKNRAKVIKEVYTRKKQLRQKLAQYKYKLGCSFCQETESCCLEFHHKDQKYKERTISDAVTHGWGWVRLLKEIQKCEVVCANCHKKIHAGKLNATIA